MLSTRNCLSCKTDFEITSEDQAFYEKMQVPEPRLCPHCRMQRRMLFFNERSLYKRVCDLCKKEVISNHPPTAKHPVYCQPCWWSDGWDPTTYGRDYDFSRPFFEQFGELLEVVPLPALNTIYTSNVNSEYVNYCTYMKNCYLCFNSDFDEDSAFSCYLEQSKRCYDVDHGLLNELCYDSIGLYKSYNCKYSANLDECLNVLFSRDLKNCSNCFGCINLRSKQYCYFNEQLTKEEYAEKVQQHDLKDYQTVQKLKKETEAFFLTQPRKYLTGIGNQNVTGDYIFWSKNVHDSYDMVGVEDSRYCQFFIIEGAKNCMDITMWGSTLMNAYECCGVGNNQNTIKFCFDSWNEASNLTYCRLIYASCFNLFGCISMRNKQYCILNKQYNKADYEAFTQKIIAKMKEDGEYGEFFPPALATYGYNESFANKYIPLTKEAAIAKGFRWTEPERKEHQIGGDVIACTHGGGCTQQCSTAFKLTPTEKAYYEQLGIPLPQLCPNCRHYERLKLRNSVTLYPRVCMKCDKAIQTSFAPDRPEIVYCETCYNAEVA